MRQKCHVCHWLSQCDCLQKPVPTGQDAACTACNGSGQVVYYMREKPHTCQCHWLHNFIVHPPEMVNKVSSTGGKLSLLVRWIVLQLLSHHVFSAHTQLPVVWHSVGHSVGQGRHVRTITRVHGSGKSSIGNTVSSNHDSYSAMLIYLSSSSSCWLRSFASTTMSPS